METEKQLQKIHDSINKAWKQLDDMWHKVGHDRNVIQKRKDLALKHTEELFHDFLTEEGDRMRDIEEKLEGYHKEVLQLLKELTMDTSIGTDTKARSHGKPLLEQEKIYFKVVEDLRKRKAARMEKYDKVNNQVQELIEEMDEDSYTIEFDGIPSDAQVGLLEQKLHHLQQEKVRRHNLFKKLKKTINNLFSCMERIPKNELERLIALDESPQNMKILSSKTLHEMEDLQSSIHQEIVLNREEAEKLWVKIRELWSRLTIDEELQSAFERVHLGIQCTIDDKEETIYKPTVVRGLQIEFNRLEEEKRKNMALFIGQVRDELTATWRNKCFMSDTSFRFTSGYYAHLTEFTEDDFFSDVFTEELLQKHEDEAQYWRDFVERNARLIDDVRKREEMFSQYRELDQKSDDPSRLANRGGALLKEEKERKTLEKKIPKLENELKLLSKKFENSQDEGFGMKKFLVYGQEIPDLIQTDWSNFHDEKEKRKEMRKKEAAGLGKSMMTTQLGPRPAKRPATPAGLTTPKRARIPASPLPGGKNFTTTPYASSTGSSAKKPPAATISKPPVPPMDNDNFARPATRSARKFATPVSTASGKKVLSKIPGSKLPQNAKEQVNPTRIPLPSIIVSPGTSYSDFSDHLLCQPALNSSAVSTIAKKRAPLIENPPANDDDW